MIHISKGTIAYIGGFELPDKNAAAHRVVNNAKILQYLGYKLVFFGIDHTLSDSGKKDIYAFGESYPLPYPKTTTQWIKRIIGIQFYTNILDSIEDLKVIIVYNLQSRPLALLRRYCTKRKINIVGDCTEWYDNRFSLNIFEFIKFIDTNLAMRFHQKKLDGLILISQFLKEYYSKSFAIVVPPLVDISESIWHQPINAVGERIQFVYSGTPGTSKDKTDLVIHCFFQLRKYNNFIFNIYGLSQDQFLKDYPEKKDELNELKNRVVFHGRVTHKESIKALINGDYCIFIRDRTRKNMAGFPTKFVECKTSGIGIIASDVSNIKDYANDFQCVKIFTDNNVNTICNAIENAILSGKQSKQGCSSFDFRNYITIFDDFITSLISKKTYHNFLS